jgi:deoxyribodipyrimidine photo-lyase
VAAARCVLEAKAHSKRYSESVASFIEEIVVRRELSDNFCHYNPRYDSLEGCAKWAQESLQLHASDKRAYVYTLEQLEGARTHDQLWNAAQSEVMEVHIAFIALNRPAE